MISKPKGLQFVNWFPKWKGITFSHYKGNMYYICEWSLVLGFWEIRKWQPKPFEELRKGK